MRYFFTLVILLALGTGCKPKELSGAKLKNKLIETMKDYLDKTLQPGVKYTIKDVSFYGEKKEKLYKCVFYVDMHTDKKDSTGVMTAVIPNDFSRVERFQ